MNTGQTKGLVKIGGRLALLGMIAALASALAMAASGFGYRLDLWHFRTGFTIIRWSFWIGAGAVAVSLLGLILSKGKPPRVLAVALMGIAVGVATVYIPWSWKRALDAHPYIHDITTDILNPPAFVAVKALRKEGDNPAEYDGPEVAAQQREAYPEIVTQIVAADAAAGRIEATHTSLFYGFKDDIVVRVEAEGSGARVDVRSKSRVGRSDVGQNAKRIRTFIRKFRANLA